jgi:hypothetical protein
MPAAKIEVVCLFMAARKLLAIWRQPSLPVVKRGIAKGVNEISNTIFNLGCS